MWLSSQITPALRPQWTRVNAFVCRRHGACSVSCLWPFAGTAKAFDHGKVVHGIWLRLAELRCGAWIERVPTDDNLSDLPSRRVYSVECMCDAACTRRCAQGELQPVTKKSACRRSLMIAFLGRIAGSHCQP